MPRVKQTHRRASKPVAVPPNSVPLQGQALTFNQQLDAKHPGAIMHGVHDPAKAPEWMELEAEFENGTMDDAKRAEVRRNWESYRKVIKQFDMFAIDDVCKLPIANFC